MNCIVLDAMGVIFREADDVAELLIPFIVEVGGEKNKEIIYSAYMDASLGNISADQFWSRVKVSPELEDAYLSGHSLIPDVKELLYAAHQKRIAVWCLSNDVGRWSKKLREKLEIDELLVGSVISGDVGVRKPDVGIYEILLKRCGYGIEDLIFVDDREKNVNAARALGIESMQFKQKTGFSSVIERILNAQ